MSGTTVVKLGGSLLEDSALREPALVALAARWRAGERLVVVHGGGKRIDAQLKALGIPKQVVSGLRQTDRATLEVVVSVLAGAVNKGLVADFRALGVNAVGLSGADGGTLGAELHEAVEGQELGFVGRVTAADPTAVAALLAAGFLPLVASLGMDRWGTLLNINADSAAAALAVALGAHRLVFLTDVAGVLDGAGRLIPELTLGELPAFAASAAVSGGMKPKLAACRAALEGGVPEVVVAGPDTHAAVLAGATAGTVLQLSSHPLTAVA